jgi:hypothetical protein
VIGDVRTGKSRLARDAEHTVQASALRVLWGHSIDAVPAAGPNAPSPKRRLSELRRGGIP